MFNDFFDREKETSRRKKHSKRNCF